jgi:hypothetical protein
MHKSIGTTLSLLLAAIIGEICFPSRHPLDVALDFTGRIRGSESFSFP